MPLKHALTSIRRNPLVIGIFAIAVVMIASAMWIVTRPPSNARDAGESLGSALQDGDVSRLQSMLWPKETQALHMSQKQVHDVLREVFCPEFQKLGVDVSHMKQTGGGHEWYAITDGHVSGARITVILGLLQLQANQYTTTLTDIYLSLDHAEVAADQKLGTHNAVQIRMDRNAKLAENGMPGLCDARDLSVSYFRR